MGTTEREPGSSAHGITLGRQKRAGYDQEKQEATAMRPPGLTPPASLFKRPGVMLLKPSAANCIAAHTRPAPLQHPGAAQEGAWGAFCPSYG